MKTLLAIPREHDALRGWDFPLYFGIGLSGLSYTRAAAPARKSSWVLNSQPVHHDLTPEIDLLCALLDI
jgi:hypothetical protein